MSVIGGADGPTAVLLTGTFSVWAVVGIAVLAILLIFLIIRIFKK